MTTATLLMALCFAAPGLPGGAYFAYLEPDGSVRISVRSGDSVFPAEGAPEGVRWRAFGLRAASRAAPDGVGGVLEVRVPVPGIRVRADFHLFAYSGIDVDSSGVGAVGSGGVELLLDSADARYRILNEGAALSTEGSHLAMVVTGVRIEEVFLIDLRGVSPSLYRVVVPPDVEKIDPRSASVTEAALFFAARGSDGWSVYRSALMPTGGASFLAVESVAGPFDRVEEYFAPSEGGVAFLAGTGSGHLDVFVASGSGPAVNVTRKPGPMLRHSPAEPRLALSPDARRVSYNLRVGAEPETFIQEIDLTGSTSPFQITEDQRFNPYIDQESLIFFDASGRLVFAAGHDVITTDVYSLSGLNPGAPINLTRTGSGLDPPFLTKGTLAIVNTWLAPNGLVFISAIGFPGDLSGQPRLFAVNTVTGELRFLDLALTSASGFISAGSSFCFVASPSGGGRALYQLVGDDLRQVVGVALPGEEPRILFAAGDSIVAALPGTGLVLLSNGSAKVLLPFAEPTSNAVLDSSGRFLAFGRILPNGVYYAVVDLLTGNEESLATGAESDQLIVLAAGYPLFLRGDSNRDGLIDIADAIGTLFHLFLGAPTVFCLDAADADDDGALTVTDPVRTLQHLFRGGEPLPEPTGRPGLDPTLDVLDCGK